MSRISLVSFISLVVLASACAPTSNRIVLIADGNRRVFETTAITVQDVLREQHVTIGDNDKVDPPLYAEVGRSATITITRVEIKTETITQPIPFARQLVRDETYPQGQVRVVRLGSNGTVAITYTIALEQGKEVSRRETARQVVTQPQDEILALGTLNSLAAVPLPLGTVAYLANGNAWVMRHSSGEKRALTSTSDLDGRVFALSADGRDLLFSRFADENAGALNSLWLIDTLVLGETPRPLPVNDVLFAQWSPDARAVAYSTGEKTPGAPGWKAHNDLWILPIALGDNGLTTQPPQPIWQAGIPAPLSWWGANFAWAPDGRAIAYAFANEIGLTELNPASLHLAPRRPLKSFAPFRTKADWAWVPTVAWSPDSRFVIGAVHAPLGNPKVASDDPTFEVWALARDGSVNAPLAKQTGMWASPAWSPPDARGESRIAFGVALAPSDSERSRYALWVMDRDGGNKKQIFPIGNDDGLSVVQAAWSPDARQLIAVREGDLWLYDFASGKWSQLTANGASSLPKWGK